MKFAQALPELLADLENALVHLGRGDLAIQLRKATIGRWTYDDFSDVTYLFLGPAAANERLSLYDELGVNVDTDEYGQVHGIEILEGRAIAARLQQSGM